MGSVVGGITDAIGLTDNKGQRDARRDSASAADNAYNLSKENIDFQREQYEDWKAVYGELQDNLGEYFNSLGAEKITTLGLQEQQLAHQQSEAQIKKIMGQRGLGNSNFETYALATNDMNNNSQRANIRATAEERAAQHKMSFLGMGLGQGTQMLGQINTATGTGVNSLNNQANMYSSQFNTLANNNAAMMRKIVEEGSQAAGAYFGSDISIKTNISKVAELKGHNLYSFEYKDKPGTTYVGVLAQEVEQIAPNAVKIINGVKHVNYNKLFGKGE